MTGLVILTILLIFCGSVSVYRERKRQREEYAQYMARRIAFSASEVNSEK